MTNQCLKVVGYAVAMGNASEELKKLQIKLH